VQQLLSSLGPVTAVIGAQWGDEGKGKVVDLLAGHFDVIARACGGANAGHTIVVQGQKRVFHLLPSGSLHPGKSVVLGAGMVVHFPTLLEEIGTLKEAGIAITNRLTIAGNTHILLEAHKAVDAALEERREKSAGQGIGTTKRGIGPAYMDKASRSGLRAELLLRPPAEVKQALAGSLERLRELFGIGADLDAEYKALMEAKELLQTTIHRDVPGMLADRMEGGERVLIEGAQGVLLDIDHGTYPYVTSSSTTIMGALQGLGIPPQRLRSCIGVAKAYCTRVGSGAFPTEAEGADQQRLRDRGGEYGATTGRPRRCGWIHLPDLRRAARLNGITHWNLTKLDVLDTEEHIPVGVREDSTEGMVFGSRPGWRQSTVGKNSWEELPENARKYIEFIEEETGVPVSLIGTGPDREHMIIRS